MMESAPATGREITELALRDSGIKPEFIGIQDVRRNSGRLFRLLRERQPSVIVIEAPSVESVDVMALRWMFPGGITPLILCPSSLGECVEMAGTAAAAAQLVKAPVFMVVEEGLEDRPEDDTSIVNGELSYDEPAPHDADDLEGEIISLESRLSRPIRGLRAGTFNPCPPELGRPEWLVISYGSTLAPASSAVAQARELGQRVSLLNLRMLWPVPEGEILRAAMGIKHVVVAERNLGQYAQEVRRLLPEIAVVPAGRVIGPVPAELILERLQTTPRCC